MLYQQMTMDQTGQTPKRRTDLTFFMQSVSTSRLTRLMHTRVNLTETVAVQAD
jgi:hypothetical protein